MYSVFRKIETGELLAVASLDDLNEAKQLVRDFKEDWPGDYSRCVHGGGNNFDEIAAPSLQKYVLLGGLTAMKGVSAW